MLVKINAFLYYSGISLRRHGAVNSPSPSKPRVRPRACGAIMDRDVQVIIIALVVVTFWLLLGLYAFCRLRKREPKADPNSLPRGLIRLPGRSALRSSPPSDMSFCRHVNSLARMRIEPAPYCHTHALNLPARATRPFKFPPIIACRADGRVVPAHGPQPMFTSSPVRMRQMPPPGMVVGPDGRPVSTPGLPPLRPMTDSQRGMRGPGPGPGEEPPATIPTRPAVTIQLRQPRPEDLVAEADGSDGGGHTPGEESGEPAAPVGSADPDFFYPKEEPGPPGPGPEVEVTSVQGERLDRWSEIDHVDDIGAPSDMATRSSRAGVLRRSTESQIKMIGAAPDNISVTRSGSHDHTTSASRVVNFSPEVGVTGAPPGFPPDPLHSGFEDASKPRLQSGSRVHDQPYLPEQEEQQPYPSFNFEQDPYAAHHSYMPDDAEGWAEPAPLSSKTSSVWQLKRIASARQSKRTKAHRKAQSSKQRQGQSAPSIGSEYGQGPSQPPGFEYGEPPMKYGQSHPDAHRAPPHGAPVHPHYREPSLAPSGKRGGRHADAVSGEFAMACSCCSQKSVHMRGANPPSPTLWR